MIRRVLHRCLTACVAIAIATAAYAGERVYLSTFPNVRAAFDAAAGGGTLVVDEDRAADTATGTLQGLWCDLTIVGTNGHRISGSVIFDGQSVLTGEAAFTNRTERWLPVGTTNLSFFPPLPLGCPLVLETTRQAAYRNQCGIEFFTAARAERDGFALDADLAQPGEQGLRTAFFNPIARPCEGRAYHGTLARGATRLPGAEWSALFRPGDIARLENVSGTDSADGDTHYFENVEVLAADASGITFAPLVCAFGTPFVARTAFGRGLTVEGAAFESLTVNSYKDVTIRALKTERLRLFNCYRFEVRDVEAVTSKPFSYAASFTFCKIGRVDNVLASGGRSSADNANIKFMSPLRVEATRLTSLASCGLRGDQAMCGIFQDYCYSPYVTWGSDCRFAALRARKPEGGAPVSVWFTGLRDSTIADVDAGDGNARYHKTANVTLSGSNACGRITDFFMTSGSSFDFGTSAYVRIAACKRSDFTGTVSGGDGTLQHDGRNVWVSGDGTAAHSEAILLHDIRSTATNAATFIWLQQVDGVRVERCSDQPRDSAAWSLHRGAGVSGLTLSDNDLRSRH